MTEDINLLKQNNLCRIIEGALLASGEPISVDRLLSLFEEEEQKPDKQMIRDALSQIDAIYQDRGITLKELASGYQFQVKDDIVPWVRRLWTEKPIKYSRALLEVLAIIAYRQPVTRGEIEELRGVNVSSKMMQTLLEHNWIRVTGHKQVPGKPTLYGTTKYFLDYFGLKQLAELPTIEVILEELSESENAKKIIEEAPIEEAVQEELFESGSDD